MLVKSGACLLWRNESGLLIHYSQSSNSIRSDNDG